MFLFLSKNRRVNSDPFIVVYSEEKCCIHSGTAVTNLCFSQPHSLHFWHCRSVSLHHVTQTLHLSVWVRVRTRVCVWVWIRFKEGCLRRIQIPWVVCTAQNMKTMHHIKTGCFSFAGKLWTYALLSLLHTGSACWWLSFSFLCTYFTGLTPSSSSFGNLKYKSETRVMFFAFFLLFPYFCFLRNARLFFFGSPTLFHFLYINISNKNIQDNWIWARNK